MNGVADTYNVECEEETGISGTSAYPTIAIASGASNLPSNATFAGNTTSTTCSTANGGTTTTSGSGTTEEYVTICQIAGTPAASQSPSAALQFTATPGPFTGSTLVPINSATLDINYVNPSTPTCIDPATAGTTTTFYEGTNSKYTVECEDTSGVSGVPAYPSQLAETGSLSWGGSTATFGTGGGSTCSTSSGGTTTTSGSGTTEDYILECSLADSPVPADAGSHTSTYQATNSVGVSSGNGTSGANSGTLTVNVTTDTVTCIDPASGGSSATFAEGTDATYQVECEDTSGISGVTAYPSSVTINSGAFPVDANQTFGGSAQTTCGIGSGATTTTSGSGTTEDYITECALTADTTAADASGGPNYPFNFTATGPSGYGGTAAPSGTLTATAATPKATGCLDPASGGSTTTFYAGALNSYTTECYAESGVTGVSAYPATVTPTAGTGLPSDATFGGNGPTSACGIGNGATTTTSGSGTTEEYITECAVAENAVSADDGTYTSEFQASAAGAAASGLLTINVQPPTTTCSAPAAAGTTTTFTDGSSGSYSVTCYTQGFSSANAGNYPASINITSGSLPAQGAGITYGGSYQTTCAIGSGATTTTSGSGATEEYETVCKVAGTPVDGLRGDLPARLHRQPGFRRGC